MKGAVVRAEPKTVQQTQTRPLDYQDSAARVANSAFFLIPTVVPPVDL